MSGPILQRPPFEIDSSVLKNPKPGATEFAAVNKAVAAALGAEAEAIASNGGAVVAAAQNRWTDIVEPQLLAVAGVDPKAYAGAVVAFQAELEKAFAEKAKGKRSKAIASAHKKLPPELAKVAGVLKKVPAIPPGSSVFLCGPACATLFDLAGGAELALIEWFAGHEHPSPQCVDQTFTPPYPVTATANAEDSDQVVPDTGLIWLGLYNGVAGWPHKSALFGAMFTVRDTDTHVSVSATLDVATCHDLVVGFPFAHAWGQVVLSVDGARGQVAASPVTSVFDDATEFLPSQHDIPVGVTEQISPACSFDRAPGDPVSYVVALHASVDLTVLGLAYAECQLKFTLAQIQVHACGT